MHAVLNARIAITMGQGWASFWAQELFPSSIFDSIYASTGFTFSFPMIQKGLKKGILVTWTKSFANPDGVGEDAVKMLEDALARRGVQYDVTSRINKV